MTLRPTNAGDMPALQTVLDRTELFPSEMLPDMLAPFLAEGGGTDIWLTLLIDDVPAGFCFAEPEPLTADTWNMRAIAVLPDRQGRGHGGALVRQLEADLRARDGRVLIVDTSGTADFAAIRTFYARNGYTEEARIRDYWAPGDDKVIFHKSLI